jgi:hypothetical protein
VKAFLLILLFLPTVTFSQQKKTSGFFQFEFGTYLIQERDPAIGVQLSGNGEFGKGFYTGLGIGVVKFQNLDGVYIPINLKFTLIAYKNKTSPMIILDPGYGAYKNSIRVGSISIVTQGGFNFFGGLGIAFGPEGKGRGFIAAGYQLFGFQVNEKAANTESIGIKFGLMIH